MAETIVKLSRRYEVPGAEPFDSITLREPTYADMFIEALGKPEEWQPTGKGTAIHVTYPAVVDAYLQRLIVAPGYQAITTIAARDSAKLERAVCGFFRELTD